MRIVTKIALLLFFFHLTPAFSLEKAVSLKTGEGNTPKPKYFFVGSADDDKIIKFNCNNGVNENEIICNTILIALRNEAKFKNTLHDASNENGLDEGMLKDLQKAIQDNPSLNEGRIDEYGKQRTDGQKQYLDNLSSKIKNIRSATSHNKLKQAVTEFLEIQLNTCQVFAFSNEPYVFKATENNKWTSVTKSNEHCNVEFIQELTPSKDGGDTWNLVQTYTEAKNNSDQACKKDYPEYRYNYYGGGISYITEPKCKYIELQ